MTTTTTPNKGWATPGFNDTNWRSAVGGSVRFGSAPVVVVVVRRDAAAALDGYARMMKLVWMCVCPTLSKGMGRRRRPAQQEKLNAEAGPKGETE